jgi:hypothetical protein
MGEVVQFIPKANPNRDVPVEPEGDGGIIFGGVIGCKYWKTPYDYATSDYVAPDGDCA